MKRIVMLSCLFLFMLTATQVAAQDKTKVKDDKTKVKDANTKVKNKDDKTKIKDGDDKTKIKADGTDDKTKIKTDDDKTKIKMDDDKTKIKTDNNQVTTPGTVNPYTAAYSSNFVVGNPAHAKMIVDMWKDWDDNAFDRHDYWADTVNIYLSDGNVIKGKTASIEGAKKYRGAMTSSKSTIDAWVPLKSTDRNEDWVAIWGTETNTWPDGKVVSNQIHEVWRINKDGKIDLLRQFTAKTTPTQPTLPPPPPPAPKQ